jgi:Tol biopolymer transport system component
VTPLKLPPGPFTAPRISPDGTRVAFGSDDGKDASVWIYELAGTTSPRQLTISGINRFPIWSADGQRVVFQSDREGDAGLFWQRADGTGPVERLTKSETGESHAPESWSPGGDTLIFAKYGRSVSLWTLSLRGKKIERFGDAESLEMMDAVFSPDGRWVAYDATQPASQSNVFVEPFPRTGARYLIATASVTGARNPFWSPDSKALTYATGPNDFAMVTISTDRGFAFSNPSPVARGPLAGGDAGAPSRRNYDPAGDGKRILGVIDPLESGVAPTQLQVVLNWQEELKQRVSTR